MNSKVLILTEDTYGKFFFKTLTERLKKEGLIPRIHVSTIRFCGPCNPKLDRQIEAFSKLRGFNSFIIFADADGKPKANISQKIQCHVKKRNRNFTKIIILDNEIEDWLCLSKSLPVSNTKPSEVLRRIEGYEKFKLDTYAKDLDFGKLTQQCPSFASFLSFIRSVDC